ncbi:MAG: hypothetical protein DRR03_06050 [Gammaproteobacteria bacterium]|nr:MAG: hypothetical protein DRR03_06050 [Gammaproteobacteria bacterium]
MHVRCPSCQTVFRLPPRALETARGLVRCGCCDALFDGRLELVPAYTSEPEPGLHDDPTRATVHEQPDRAPELADTGTGAAMDVDPDAILDHDEPIRRASHPAPEEVLGLEQQLAREPRRPAHPGRTLLLAFANVLLLGLLGVQLVLGLREPLLAAPDLRPWLERGCAFAGCRLPALRDPERVEILARDIRAHPRFGNGLLVDVTIVNRAPYTQPFPVMQLTFTSLDEQWFAQRRFKPAEYLGPNRGTAERLPPDIPVQVVLELLDPGPEAVSYNFDFL